MVREEFIWADHAPGIFVVVMMLIYILAVRAFIYLFKDDPKPNPMADRQTYEKLSMDDFDKIATDILGPTPKPGDRDYVGHVQGGMYQIGPGIFTGKKGWENFVKALREAAKNMYDE